MSPLRTCLRFLLCLSLLSHLSLPAPLQAATSKEVQQDLNYYHRISSLKNLGANDRLHILYRMREKHAAAGRDVSELDREIRQWESVKTGPEQTETNNPPKDPTEGNEPPADSSVPQLVDLRREEAADAVKVVIRLTKPVVPQAVRVDDPQRPDRPMLLIDLPGTENRLARAAQDMKWEAGALASVAVSKTDEGALRVQVQMRGNRPYRVVRAGREITVEVKQENNPTSAPSLAPKEAPDAAPTPPVTGDATDKSYVLQPGDLLNIVISPAKELSREAVVQPDGTLVFPLAGTFAAKGLTVADLERTLVQKLKPYVTKPSVDISIKQFSNSNVFIMGKVMQPGPISYRSGLRLLSAISAANGFSDDADRTAIKIYRGRDQNRKSFIVNAEEILKQGDLSKDFLLQPGDIIEVQRGGNTVSVIGQIYKPGNYPFKEGYTLLELISDAGGTTMGAKPSQVKIFRETPDKRKIQKVNLARIMKGRPEEDVSLQPGDIILVPQGPLYSGTNTATNLFMPWLSLTALILALAVAAK